MQDYALLQCSLKGFSDTTVTSGLATSVGQGRHNTATTLAYIAEFDDRKLYLPAAYPSMHAYSVGELRFSDDAAYKRIHAARAARKFPAILPAVAEGRLHLTAVCLLAPHLTTESADSLIAAATHKSKFEIERLLAARAPRPDLPAFVRALPARGASGDTAPAPTEMPEANSRRVQLAPGQVALNETPDSARHAANPAPAQLPAATPPRLTPLAPERFALQVTIDQRTHDKLRRAQELLGHQVASRDLAGVLDRALDALIAQLEKRKYAATKKPRTTATRRASANPRYIPAHVRRTVRERDGDQCTFVSAAGRRCEARARLEFDHVHEVARGGVASVGDIRLRCRAHNQFTAEQTFGAGFMDHKRREAREVQRPAKSRADEVTQAM